MNNINNYIDENIDENINENIDENLEQKKKEIIEYANSKTEYMVNKNDIINNNLIDINSLIICDYCNKIFTRKDNLLRHLRLYCNKKKEEILNNMKLDKYIMIQSKEEINKCNYCNKIFTRYDSLVKHLENRCKIKKLIDKEKEEIYQQLIKQKQDELNLLISQYGKNNKINITNDINTNNIKNEINTNNIINEINTNNIININNINNIKLVAFGKEDLSFLTDNAYKTILNKGFTAVPEMVKSIHFNKNKPEYHNVYISNMRDSYAMIYDGNKWCLKDRNEILDQLYDDKLNHLTEKFEELYYKLELSCKKKFQRFLDSQIPTVINNIKKDIKLVIYNNKHMVELIKNKMSNKYIKY